MRQNLTLSAWRRFINHLLDLSPEWHQFSYQGGPDHGHSGTQRGGEERIVKTPFRLTVPRSGTGSE